MKRKHSISYRMSEIWTGLKVVKHEFRDLLLGSNKFVMLTQQPQKMMLASKFALV